MEDLQQEIEHYESLFAQAKVELGKVIVGNDHLINCLFNSLLNQGHVLIEGLPGLAKSLTVSSMAKILDLSYCRLQFTPDLLPSDIIGNSIFNFKTQDFEIKKGPIFHNFILVDEINRAPAKVHSALLEAMEEKQVSIAGNTYLLDNPFIVIATQNPIEQEGTFNLPEAGIDRFMMKVEMTYLSREEEVQLLAKKLQLEDVVINPCLSSNDLLSAQKLVKKIHIDDKLLHYIVDIIEYTRSDKLKDLLDCGASARASISLLQASKAQAFLQNRVYVVPEDIQNVAIEVLQHRIKLSFAAESKDVLPKEIIGNILVNIPQP